MSPHAKKKSKKNKIEKRNLTYLPPSRSLPPVVADPSPRSCRRWIHVARRARSRLPPPRAPDQRRPPPLPHHRISPGGRRRDPRWAAAGTADHMGAAAGSRGLPLPRIRGEAPPSCGRQIAGAPPSRTGSAGWRCRIRRWLPIRACRDHSCRRRHHISASMAAASPTLPPARLRLRHDAAVSHRGRRG